MGSRAHGNKAELAVFDVFIVYDVCITFFISCREKPDSTVYQELNKAAIHNPSPPPLSIGRLSLPFLALS
jgi:hypothetical protein